MSEQMHISQKSILLWRIRCTALAVPLFFSCGVMLKFSLLWGFILLIVSAAVYALAMLWYFPRRYRSIAYQFGENKTEIQAGVFFQNIYQLEYSSIVFTRCAQTPLQHIFKICTLQLHPIGKAINLPQLPIQEAKDLLHVLEEKCNEV